jgi:hypothetical protein
LAVQAERRNAEEQVPLRQIEDIAKQMSTLLRAAFERFLSSEYLGLMAIIWANLKPMQSNGSREFS